MSTATLAPEKLDKISSPVLRALLKEKKDSFSSKSEVKNSVYNYDKYTHEKTSECICVIGGM